MKNKFYPIWAIVSIIIVVVLYFLSKDNSPFTRIPVLSGSLFLAIITLISYYVSARNIHHENPNRFVRGVMGGTFIKFLLCIIGASFLLFTLKKNLQKIDLYLLMFEYILYTILETTFLSLISRKQN